MSDDIVTRLRNWHTDHDSAVPRPIDLEAADEIERWRELAIHAWCHMGMDATCSDDDCDKCQAIKKEWENK
jgi:hypothetical protein